ncbi:MAG TPA: pyridoxamine 5'-phosphate oxidase family protein [Myxococcota bacterium]|nr:pyridoxamine 5'-phosphate oxidase family protein [Myxococcota bacterium]
MPELERGFLPLLLERRIATLATTNPDGSPHLTAVWFLFAEDRVLIATSSRSRKARNVVERPSVAFMVDVRVPGSERGVTGVGLAELLRGPRSQQINRAIHGRYLRAAALEDPEVGPRFAALDDVTISLRPARWFSWDMAALDGAAFGGRIASESYLLPLET